MSVATRLHQAERPCLAEIELQVVERDDQWFVAQVKDGVEIMGPSRFARTQTLKPFLKCGAVYREGELFYPVGCVR
jgi:hypothetical protein